MSRKAFLLVTGASRGLGNEITKSFIRSYLEAYPASTLEAVLVSRSTLDPPISDPKATIKHVQLDLADVQSLQCQLPSLLPTDHTHAYLINNAGSLGPLSPSSSFTPENLSQIEAVTTLNVSSFMILTSAFLSSPPQDKQIINISSLAAVQPFPTWSLYCAGKAARDMYIRCLALENPGVNFLNYAPGPMDTEMQSEIRSSDGCDSGTREYFQKAKADGALVDPRDSADKLVGMMVPSPSYESGGHVDYYDPPAKSET